MVAISHSDEAAKPAPNDKLAPPQGQALPGQFILTGTNQSPVSELRAGVEGVFDTQADYTDGDIVAVHLDSGKVHVGRIVRPTHNLIALVGNVPTSSRVEMFARKQVKGIAPLVERRISQIHGRAARRLPKNPQQAPWGSAAGWEIEQRIDASAACSRAMEARERLELSPSGEAALAK